LISEKGLQWQLGTTMFGRFEYWRVAWEMTVEQALLGTGIGMYEPLSIRYMGSPIAHPHNGLLEVLCATGFVGLVAFLLLMVVTVREVLGVRKHGQKNEFVRVADMLLLGVAVWVAVVSIPSTIFLIPKPMILLWALLGARLAVARGARSAGECPGAQIPVRAR
jgi:O-antigen ligase